MQENIKAAQRAIKSLGGPSALAERLWNDRRKQNVVNNWRVRGIPADYAPTLADWSGVPLGKLRPKMVRR